MRVLALLAATGCAAKLDGGAALTVEPAAIELTVVPGQPAPAVALHVYGDGVDVTADAAFVLAGAQLGRVDPGKFISDGKTGGSAAIGIAVHGGFITVPVKTRIESVRFEDGLGTVVAGTFAGLPDVRVDATLDPGDGTVLPANLGRIDVAFGAVDTDTLHELTIEAPDLAMRIYTRGEPGPRSIALTPTEWDAVVHTAIASGVDVTVRSIGSDANARTDSAHYMFADLPLSPMLFTGTSSLVGTMPSLYRYDVHDAQVRPFMSGKAGACLGCHVAVSPDGKRLAAGTSTPTALLGVVIDLEQQRVMAPPTEAWQSATFDPGGALVTAGGGAMTVRDGATGQAIAAVTTGELVTSPTISPDGGSLAYVTLEGPSINLQGAALHVRQWSAPSATLSGATIELTRGGGIKSPEFSPDGRWLVFSRAVSPSAPDRAGVALVWSTGGPIVELSSDARDSLAHWASPIQPAVLAGGGAEPMAWLVMQSRRPVGARAMDFGQLWLIGFFPNRGAMTRPFHLPGQPGDLCLLHAPMRVPQ